VEDGVLDAGICGYDWVVENGADVVEVRRRCGRGALRVGTYVHAFFG
jgi:ATP phosphoribosyltransferase